MPSQEKPQPLTRGQALHRVQMGLRRLTQQLHRLNDVVGSQIDLLPGDLEVLDIIGRDGPMSPRDLSAATGIHPATLTGVFDRLEQGGWLSRHPDPDDRRRIIVAAETARSADLTRRYAPMSKAITHICTDYSNEELARIVAFLDRAAEAGAEVAAEMRKENQLKHG